MLRQKTDKKTDPISFQKIIDGDQTFDICKEETYDVGNIIVLKEFDTKNGYTGRKAIVVVTSRLSHSEREDIPQNMCIVSIRLLAHRMTILPPNIREVLC